LLGAFWLTINQPMARAMLRLKVLGG